MYLYCLRENKIFKVSKCKGICIKGLVANTEPFRIELPKLIFVCVFIKVDANFKTCHQTRRYVMVGGKKGSKRGREKERK